MQEVVDHALRPLMEERGAYFCTQEQMLALGPVCYDAERTDDAGRHRRQAGARDRGEGGLRGARTGFAC